MKKTIITFFVILLIGIISHQASAIDGWETTIVVTSGNAESHISFGQKPDATDLNDGLYDVPAMLSGEIQVYSETKEGSLWRDIRAIGTGTEWRLIITSQTGKPLTISWNPTKLPDDLDIKLFDTASEKETDMKKSAKYILQNTSSTLLLIEVTNK